MGAAYAFGLLGILSIGLFVLPCAVLATVYAARQRHSLRGIAGLLSGVGMPLLLLAYLNRDGPGLVCDGDTCGHQSSPWPWLIAGVLFVLVGGATHVLTASRRRNW